MGNEKVNAVKNIQHYVLENVHNPITLADLAKVSHYSLWYTAKIFKELTGKTIFDYIRLIRLTAAAKELRDTKSRVIDVAFDFVFDSHEGFTRAFAKEFNITPKVYQTSPIPLQYFTPYYVMDRNMKKGEKKMKEIKAVFIQILERPKRKAIIKRGIKATEYFEYCEEVGCDIWGVLCSIKEAIGEPIGMWISKKMQKEGTSLYIQGVEVPYEYNGAIPDGYEIIELPAAKFLVFQGEPYDDENFEEEVRNVMDFVTKYNPAVYGFEYDEDGYRFQYAPEGYRGYIEGRAIKQK
ncbi:MAG: AraC family transcriptional regulator [Bacilli bacterium]|nr:AraC family transcriptional regulator [Bacilli bacterium]